VRNSRNLQVVRSFLVAVAIVFLTACSGNNYVATNNAGLTYTADSTVIETETVTEIAEDETSPHSDDADQSLGTPPWIGATFWLDGGKFERDADDYLVYSGQAFAIPPSAANNRDAVGVVLPVQDPSWWLAPEDLATVTDWGGALPISVAEWSFEVVDSTVSLSAYLRYGERGPHSLVATGRLGWRDGIPVVLKPSFLDPGLGAEISFAETDPGQELRQQYMDSRVGAGQTQTRRAREEASSFSVVAARMRRAARWLCPVGDSVGRNRCLAGARLAR